ncbi:MAG: tRNA (adenosine(37)-N6)-threonylcarbamoyltransferase complex dimerization subunit type 1 TsaB [Spirochaetia bacterium]
MNVLAMDTATEVLALCASRDEAWASLCLRRGLQHSPSLLPLAEHLLAQMGLTAADLDLVVCSVGPGSFTGIRIGLATALGISHGRGIPVVGVSTLDATARAWEAHDGPVYPVIDARKGKIYFARFSGGIRQGEYHDGTPADLAAEIAAVLAEGGRPLIAGPDAERIRGMLGDAARAVPCGSSLDPLSLLRVGVEKYTKVGADPESLRPLYLRKSEAEIASGL